MKRADLSMRRPGGMTLGEVLVGIAVVALLMGVTFAIYQMGASAFMKGNTRSELMQDALVTVEQLTREVERSVYGSVSLTEDGTAVAFLSAVNPDTGRFEIGLDTSKPLWQRYVICYYDAEKDEVRWQEVRLAAGADEITTPGPIERYNPGSGTKPLADWISGGKVLARNIASCRFQFEDRLMTVTLEGKKKRYGSQKDEEVKLSSTALFRN